MNPAEATTIGPTIALHWKRQVDAVCEEFEDAWAEGSSPKVEEYLDKSPIPAARRAALLAELLKLERELRQKKGDKPAASEYLIRFPTYPVVVRSIFGEDRVGEYDLISPIGEGGMGIVYHARHRRIGREVALKMIRPYCLDDSSAVDRFRLEAQLAARLEHENIVTVYEAGMADGQHFYAMRYIGGQSLSEAIGRAPLDPLRAAKLMEQVARAVDFAHTHDVLHRDVKPRNILVDPQDRAYVTDFGLAKALSLTGGGGTRTDDRLGTPPYMSPEQVRDPSRAGVASDVYSLGATLYECLTGRPPFQDANPLEVYRQVLDVEPPRPRTVNPKCPRDLETICLKCMEKEPSRRYASALQLADDLHRFREHAPILARPVGPFERVAKWARKHPTAAGLIVALIVAIAALAAVVQARRTNAIIEKSYEQARTAVDSFTQFGEQELADQPALRQKLLEISLRYYDAFLAQRGTDPAVASELSATFTRVARLSNALNSRPRALDAHKQALAIRRGLVARSLEDRRARAAVAETLHDIGILERALGHRDASIDALREALTIRERLSAEDPECRAFLAGGGSTPSPEDRILLSDLARSHGYIGDWERESGLRDAAKVSYKSALTIRKKLSEDFPDDLIAKFQLARSMNNAGIMEREDGHNEEAIAAHHRALKLQAELASISVADAKSRLASAFRASNKAPDVEQVDFPTDLATTEGYLGILYEESNRPGPAIDHHLRAETILDTLAREYKGLPRWDTDRALTATYLGELRKSATDLDRGRKLFDSLLETDPDAPRIRAGLARNLAASGVLSGPPGGTKLLERALRAQEQLVREQPENFDFRQDLKRTQAAIAASRTR